MRESLHFTFNGESSEDMGVIIASPNGGLFQESFLPTRSIIESSVANRRYFKRAEDNPLSFSLTIFIEEWRERDNLRQIARWLYQDYYKPLWFDTNPELIYYAIFEGDSSLFHNGCKDGYIQLNVRCDSPYRYSPVKSDAALSSDGQLTIFNEGDITVKPKARIKKTNAKGDIEIRNTTTNQVAKFTDIQLDEELFVDFHNEEIVSSLQYLNIYRFADFNHEWIELVRDENVLEFVGDFEIEFEYEFAYLAE